ncbi:MAG: type II toxin-antitoxin system RelE/ParE family toxin [Patescibacteria group bacterium]|mgnify:CR=1 FL=1
MLFSLYYSDKAFKNLKQIPRKWQERIVKAVDGLKKHPYEGKKLCGQFDGCFSLRVWPYRIIYIVNQRKITIVVLDIGHR